MSASHATAKNAASAKTYPITALRELKIILDHQAESPFEPRDKAIGLKAWPDHIFAACSVQHFDPSTGAGNLSQTHADAQGWVNYLSQFEPANFWFKDASVSTWEYLDPTDD